MNVMPKWTIEELPFIWGAQTKPHNTRGLPDELPFTLTLDERTGLVVQEYSPMVAACLASAYEAGSVLGSNVDEDGLGRRYADDFLGFIARSMAENPALPRRSVLEIGCGNGYLLSRLCDSFGSVLGIEPGPHGQAGAKRYGVEIVRDFFPSAKLAGRRFSAIVLTSVFEHVEDPVRLAATLTEYLEPGGRVFVSVPDEGAYIRHFDVSTLFHEHWSYFDQQTLQLTMAIGGLSVERCEGSIFGASIYADLSAKRDPADLSKAQLAASIEIAGRYIERARTNCERLRDTCAEMLSGGKTLGVYVPARFVNAMKINGTPHAGVRFFDDDPLLQGSFYPGIPIPVESRPSLLANPVDTVLIMSRTFGGSLAEKLKVELPATTRVVVISELLD